MDPRIHEDIVRKLEAFKTSGLISDYWVCWVGRGGTLDPVVRTWAAAEEQSTRAKIAKTLAGIVAQKNIRVIAE